MKLQSRFFIVSLLLLNALPVASQSAKKQHPLYYIIADTAKLRADAGFAGNVIKIFHKGDSVRVLKVGKMGNVKGMAAPWFDVGYTVGNSERRGFIWGGYLSPRKPK